MQGMISRYAPLHCNHVTVLYRSLGLRRKLGRGSIRTNSAAGGKLRDEQSQTSLWAWSGWAMCDHVHCVEGVFKVVRSWMTLQG